MRFDLDNVIKKYSGKWIALDTSEKIVSSSQSAKKAFSDAQKKGVNLPTLFKVPQKYIPYIG